MTPPLIVVVEDDLDTLAMLDTLLTNEGYRTLLWPRGKGAFRMIRNTLPDLVILDMWMEEKDTGEKVMARMQGDAARRHIPVILCSAYVRARHPYVAEMAAKGYRIQEKPFPPADLLTKITDALGTGKTV